VTLHPIDQDYTYSQLSEEGAGDIAHTRQALERRAADYYVQLRTPEENWKTIDDLEPQLIEFEHHVRVGDYDDACRILESIDFDYLYLWGHYVRLVEMRQKDLGRVTNPELQMANLGGLGNAYRALGQVKWAIGYYKEALGIAQETGNRQREGDWLGDMGFAYRDLGQAERAINLYQEALAVSRETGDCQKEGAWLGNLGSAYRDLNNQPHDAPKPDECGQTEQAVKLYKEAMIIVHEIGDHRSEGTLLSRLGRAYHFLGRIERAIEFHEQSLVIARRIGDRWGEEVRLGRLGNAYCDLEQNEQAIAYYKEALVIAREIGDRRNESVWLGSLGFVYHNLGQVEQAIKLYEEALMIAHEISDGRVESRHLVGLGKVLLATRKLSTAQQHCQEALFLDIPETNYQAALTLGVVLLHQHDPAAGETFADAATRCRAMLSKTAGLYEPHYALATALVGSAICDLRWTEEDKRAELLTPALAEYQRALEICAAPGVVQDAIRDLELIQAAGIEGLEPVFELLEGALEGDDN